MRDCRGRAMGNTPSPRTRAWKGQEKVGDRKGPRAQGRGRPLFTDVSFLGRSRREGEVP